MFDRLKEFDWRRLAGWLFGAVVVVIVAFYGGRAILADARAPIRLVVYAFSTQEEVLSQSIFPVFEQMWEAETGRDLTIEAVFGPSGTLARQIVLGAPADVALLSNEQHVNWLKAGKQMQRDVEPAVVSCTPMVIVMRPGNPEGINDFSDLAQPDLRLIHADPRSSGAGDWAVLAEYGSALLESGDKAEAETQVKAIWRNLRLLAPSARATLTLFELGAGEAMVTYEQDARLAQARGVPLDIVVPPRTIIAHHVAVIVDANVTRAERLAAEAFVRYLQSDAGQAAFTRCQLRPADLEEDTFPPIPQPFTVADLGGWSQAYSELIDVLWQTEIEPRLDLEPAGRLLNPATE